MKLSILLCSSFGANINTPPHSTSERKEAEADTPSVNSEFFCGKSNSRLGFISEDDFILRSTTSTVTKKELIY